MRARLHLGDRGGDVLRPETTPEDDPARLARRPLPVGRIVLAPREVDDPGHRLAGAIQRRVAAADLAPLHGVHLVEVGSRVARRADPHRDRERRVRDGEDRLGRPGALRCEDEAEQVGARLCGRGDVLLEGQPADLDERPRKEHGELRRRVGRAHQRRAHQNRIGARKLRRSALRARGDARLGDHDAVARNRRDELELGCPIDRERGKVTRVDADDRRLERDCALELRPVVGLHQRVEAEPRCLIHERRRGGVVEVAKQQEDGVRSGALRRAQVVRRGEEALCEKRRVRRRARCAKVVPRPGEALVHEHGDRGGAGCGVRGRDPGRIRVGA